jgi:outer membrane lipopolysaccharide assembly protein LptE/RlpB
MGKMNRATTTGLIGFFLFITLWGCGYRLEGRETPLPPGIQTIAIPTMANQTLEPGIENAFTEAMIREFNLDGRLKVVSEKRADSILEGSIEDFFISSISYDVSGFASEYRAIVTVGATLRRPDTGEILWSVPSLRDTQDYKVTSNVLSNEARKQEAIEEIARQLAGTVHDLIMERF